MVRGLAGQVVGAELVNATTGAAFAGTVTVYVTIDNGTQTLGSVSAGVATAKGNGLFNYLPSLAETDGALVAFTFIGTGAIPQTIQIATVTAAQQSALSAATGTLAVSASMLITQALIEIGVLGEGQTASADQTALGLKALNRLVDRWSADVSLMTGVVTATKTLTASKASYTVGVSGDINLTVWPELIDGAGIIDTSISPAVEIPIAVLTGQQYAAWPVKTLTIAGIIGAIYYDRSQFPLGVLYVLPIPTVSTLQLVLYIPTALRMFSDASNTVTLKPGVEEALHYNLALRLCQPFGKPVPPLLLQLARAAEEQWRTVNIDPGEIGVDAALRGGSADGGFDLYRDFYGGGT